ncbi:hypothetical protein [Acidibrevibacterium fodinaquatile]|uniref:hypothetical protein n=1 Tax=Acidibrevibacterium fodinaquatile TaxID=1969806 RepID=UPI000E0D84BA|nr:hypothetical protein [Acidibrevibacterium fodinaquatile]
MAEKQGKFAALAQLRTLPVEPERDDEAVTLAPSPVTMHVDPNLVARGRGRPATGKRSNPEWKLYSHFLKRKTQREAVARLQAEDEGRDLSDVLQELLENWLGK